MNGSHLDPAARADEGESDAPSGASSKAPSTPKQPTFRNSPPRSTAISGAPRAAPAACARHPFFMPQVPCRGAHQRRAPARGSRFPCHKPPGKGQAVLDELYMGKGVRACRAPPCGGSLLTRSSAEATRSQHRQGDLAALAHCLPDGIIADPTPASVSAVLWPPPL